MRNQSATQNDTAAQLLTDAGFAIYRYPNFGMLVTRKGGHAHPTHIAPLLDKAGLTGFMWSVVLAGNWEGTNLRWMGA